MQWSDEWVVRKGEELAREWGVPAPRVIAISLRIRDSQEEAAKSPDLPGPVPATRPIPPRPIDPTAVLDRAKEVLGVERTLQLFEESDLLKLSTKVSMTGRLTSNMAPRHSLDELPDLLESLISHLGQHRPSLLRTGYPCSVFIDSLWHDVRLTNLYFTKLPKAIRVRCGAGGVGHELIWPRHPVNQMKAWRPAGGMAFKLPFGGYWTSESDEDTTLPNVSQDELYDCAPIFAGLGEENARRLTDLRPRVLDAKVRALEVARDALRGRSKARLWDRCLDALSAGFNAEEAGFLLDMDAVYLCFDIRSGEWVDRIHDSLTAGGLAELLMVLAHYQKELEYGTYDKAARGAASMPGPIIGLTYYDMVTRGWEPQWDGIVKEFVQSLVAEGAFWETWAQRLTGALQTKLKVPVVLHIGEMDAGLAKQAAADLAWVSRGYVDHAERFGAPPSIQIDHKPAEVLEGMSSEKASKARTAGIHCQRQIVITGVQLGRKGNQTVVDGKEIRVPDKALAGLIRLVVAWQMRGEGWVEKSVLMDEGLLTEENPTQAVDRLRIPFRQALGAEEARLLIEGDGAGRIRLSNPIELISCDRERLVSHTDPLVKKMAKRLKRR